MGQHTVSVRAELTYEKYLKGLSCSEYIVRDIDEKCSIFFQACFRVARQWRVVSAMVTSHLGRWRPCPRDSPGAERRRWPLRRRASPPPTSPPLGGTHGKTPNLVRQVIYLVHHHAKKWLCHNYNYQTKIFVGQIFVSFASRKVKIFVVTRREDRRSDSKWRWDL